MTSAPPGTNVGERSLIGKGVIGRIPRLRRGTEAGTTGSEERISTHTFS